MNDRGNEFEPPIICYLELQLKILDKLNPEIPKTITEIIRAFYKEGDVASIHAFGNKLNEFIEGYVDYEYLQEVAGGVILTRHGVLRIQELYMIHGHPLDPLDTTL